MKWLFMAILIAQSAALAIIFSHLKSLHTTVDTLATYLPYSHNSDSTNSSDSTNRHNVRSSTDNETQPTDQLQQLAMIQKELARLSLAIESNLDSAGMRPENIAPPPSASQIERHDMLRGSLNNMMFAGPVSQMQIDNLQIQAAQLHPEQRKEMFSSIARAVNSGQLKIVNQ
ncbi:hypothetical protein [Simiduia aestuariiviva]|uniref:Small-conductance mechanosensitive channel n=1 Tax=Simiduia aestuariiviva TaxID=1510459 RepID=A0A839US79_9GAMM|nr:hypothetical protein [Simiduia aestuariiviva]MBB3169551.1 small-conductance mechanosensitive channel [Simiduia aestuariiviva]